MTSGSDCEMRARAHEGLSEGPDLVRAKLELTRIRTSYPRGFGYARGEVLDRETDISRQAGGGRSGSRAALDISSAGFIGSSMMTRFPPRPVKVPPIDVASRSPLAVVANSPSVFFCGIYSAVGKQLLIPVGIENGSAVGIDT